MENIDIHFFKKGELNNGNCVDGFIKFYHQGLKPITNITYEYEDFCIKGDLVTYKYIYENGILAKVIEVKREENACEFAIGDAIDNIIGDGCFGEEEKPIEPPKEDEEEKPKYEPKVEVEYTKSTYITYTEEDNIATIKLSRTLVPDYSGYHKFTFKVSGLEKFKINFKFVQTSNHCCQIYFRDTEDNLVQSYTHFDNVPDGVFELELDPSIESTFYIGAGLGGCSVKAKLNFTMSYEIP